MSKKSKKNQKPSAITEASVYVESPFSIPTINHDNEDALLDQEIDRELKRERGLLEDSSEDETLQAAESDDLDEALEDWKPDVSNEDANSQLDSLSKAMATESAKQEQELEEITSRMSPEDSEQELKKQIEEDMALEAQNASDSDDADADAPEVLPTLDAEDYQAVVENYLFLADKPVTQKRFKELLGEAYDEDLLNTALQTLQTRYQESHHGFELAEVNHGYQFRTKASLAPWVRKMAKIQTQRLSRGAMESLAIIAYRQPVMKEDIDKIRGVDSSHFIRTLMERRLVEIQGRSELPGRPMLYVTSPEFLETFGLKDLEAMPSLREIEAMIPSSETTNPDEDPKIKQIRKMVDQMNSDTTRIHYDPKADDVILSEIRERVGQIATSTPYLEEQKAHEKAKKEGIDPATLGPSVFDSLGLAGSIASSDEAPTSEAPEAQIALLDENPAVIEPMEGDSETESSQYES